MKLVINQQELPVQLEAKDTVESVVESIQRFLKKQRVVLEKIIWEDVAGQSIEASDWDEFRRQAKDRSISHIRLLSLEVKPIAEYFLQHLEEVDAYVDRMGSYIYESQWLTDKDIEDLKEGLQWIEESLNIMEKFYKKSHIDFPVKAVEPFLNNLKQITNMVAQAKEQENLKEELLKNLRSVKVFLMAELNHLGVYVEVDQIPYLLQNLVEETPSIAQEAVCINRLFNQANDVEALDRLTFFLRKFEFYFNVFSAVEKEWGKDLGLIIDSKQKIDFKAYLSQLKDLFDQILQALEEEDWITVGDLLEYELSQKILHWKPYLEALRQAIDHNDRIAIE